MAITIETPGVWQPRYTALHGLYLKEPHAKWIFEGKKKLIIKAKKFAILNEPFILIGDKAYGIIYVTSIKEIGLKEFEELRDKHLISDKEREEWWPEAEVLYAYEFVFKPFPQPYKYKRKKGIQTFQREVELYPIEVTKEIQDAYDGFLKLGKLRLKFYGTKGMIEESSKEHKYYCSLQINGLLLDFGERVKPLEQLDVKAILLTHSHPDHVNGLEDNMDIPIYLTKTTKDLLPKFENDYRIVKEREWVQIDDWKAIWLPIVHSIKHPACVIILERQDAKVLYAPDVLWIRKQDHDYIKDIDIYIGDGSTLTRPLVRRKDDEVFGHASVKDQLKWCMKWGIDYVIFTHFGKEAVETKQLENELKKLADEVGFKGVVIEAKDSLEIEFDEAEMSQLLKIKDIDYDPSKPTDEQLADDWRIVCGWYSTIRRKRPFKYTIQQVRNLAVVLGEEMVKRGFTFHPKEYKKYSRELFEYVKRKLSEKGIEMKIEKYILPEGMTLEDIDPDYLQHLDNDELKELHDYIHQVTGEEISETELNAHVFVAIELNKRGLVHRTVDELDKESEFWVLEYPKPPKGLVEKEDEKILLQEVLDSLPNEIELPTKTYLVGRIVNEGYSEHDIDILDHTSPGICQILAYELVKANPKLGDKLHVFPSPFGPKVGLNLPIYRKVLVKITEEIIKVKLGEAFKPPKARTGYLKNEFFYIDDLWKHWASNYIKEGLFIQPKMDGLRMLVHKDDSRVKIFTEDKSRDRAPVFKESVKELIENVKGDVILDTEMVEYKLDGKELPKKKHPAELFEQIPREDLVKWVGAKDPGSDKGIVFHVHDIVYREGKDLTQLPYSERLKILDKTIPDELRHWEKIKSWFADTKEEFEKAVKEAGLFPFSEGAMLKTASSLYKIDGRLAEWAKYKQVKMVSLLVVDRYDVRSKETGKILAYNYTVAFGPIAKEDIPKLSKDKLIEYKGKTYMILGQTYNYDKRLEKGTILEVATIRVREFKDKEGKLYYTFMFPIPMYERPERKEPDDLRFIQQLAAIGTGPLQKKWFIHLPKCPFYKDGEICPLYWIYEHPWERKGDEFIFQELRFPIDCWLADKWLCYYVKTDYYYTQNGDE